MIAMTIPEPIFAALLALAAMQQRSLPEWRYDGFMVRLIDDVERVVKQAKSGAF